MARSASGTTLNYEVEVDLRTSILRGRLRPGQRLKLADLGARYGVSLSVVREAMSRLSAQGLVQSTPQLGFRVTTLSMSDLLDLTSVRLDIETLALRRALAEGDVAWESGVVAAHHSLTREAQDGGPELGTNDRFAAAHAHFHNSITKGCSSARLQRIAESLRESAVLYQRWSISLHGQRDVQAEHLQLLNAVLSRDEGRAVTILTEHIQRTTGVLLTTLLVDPDDPHHEPSSSDAVAATPSPAASKRVSAAPVRLPRRKKK